MNKDPIGTALLIAAAFLAAVIWVALIVIF